MFDRVLSVCNLIFIDSLHAAASLNYFTWFGILMSDFTFSNWLVKSGHSWIWLADTISTLLYFFHNARICRNSKSRFLIMKEKASFQNDISHCCTFSQLWNLWSHLVWEIKNRGLIKKIRSTVVTPQLPNPHPITPPNPAEVYILQMEQVYFPKKNFAHAKVET